jgi:hypothetical protein
MHLGVFFRSNKALITYQKKKKERAVGLDGQEIPKSESLLSLINNS